MRPAKLYAWFVGSALVVAALLALIPAANPQERSPTQPGDVGPFLEAKKMRPILTLLPERPQTFSDVPAFKDIGVNIQPSSGGGGSL